ncbi:MAG: DUF456 domain-containing protein [Chloroflexota bacterium]
MSLLLQSVTFGLVFTFMIIGIVGIIIPIIPGMILVWLSALVFVLFTGFNVLPLSAFVIITLIAAITGTAEFWLSAWGAKKGGASKRSLLWGIAGSLVGTFIFPLVGTIIGYAVGILLSEYQQQADWEAAFRASVGGVAGWGLATAVQLVGALGIIGIFVTQSM